ncbi:MAG TPA: hypothetical protein VGD72_03370 [Mycobacteriales bacterium]
MAQHSDETPSPHEHTAAPEQSPDDALAALAGEAPPVGETSVVEPPPGTEPEPAPGAEPAAAPEPESAPEPEPAATGHSRAAEPESAPESESAATGRSRTAAEAHTARTVARIAEAEARVQADAEAEAAGQTLAREQTRAAAVERSRAAAAAHVVPVSPADSLGEDDTTGFLPAFGAPVAGRAAHADDSVPALRRTRRPIVGLVALVVFGMVAAFFGWVSADPFWLATGQGTTGTVTVTRCDASACEGQFSAARFTADGVALSGIAPDKRHAGATAPGRMLSGDHTWAYSGPSWALHLRWGLGLAIVLLCGLVLGAVTGARFLRPLGRRAVVGVRLLAVAGPLALFAGMLGVALL